MIVRLRCLPLTKVTEGMVLGAPLVIPEHGIISFTLPAGHALTESNLHQMSVRHAEYVCVQEEDGRTEEEREIVWTAREKRLQNIFRKADLRQPALAGLYDAVRRFRRS